MPPARTPAAMRQLRHRQRRKCGRAVYRIELPNYIVEDLMNRGELPASDTVDEAALAAVVARAIHRLLDRNIS